MVIIHYHKEHEKINDERLMVIKCSQSREDEAKGKYIKVEIILLKLSI